MKVCAVISALCFISLASALPAHHGMVYYQMPYYTPYHQAMLVHYAPSSNGRSVGSSAFAAGDAVAAGSVVKENRVPTDVLRATDSQGSSNDGNVEAIAEAYPEEPIQGTVQYDQGQEQQYNEVIPLNAAPVAQAPKEATENLAPEEPQVPTTTLTPKKKVHISIDDEDDVDENDDFAPSKPSRGGSPTYTFFPVSFGRAAGGTIAVANAYSTGKGAVRSHAIAYGTNGASSRQLKRSAVAQKSA